ncbi:MAG: TIGR01459 family HAD-type hydrolase [Pseudomonadota bacterium]
MVTQGLGVSKLVDIAGPFDAVVFDQWGVLHNGAVPYPGAVQALSLLAKQGKTLAVLSNSGKRAATNAKRIADMGLPANLFAHVMTSGEAFWQDYVAGRVPERRLFPITAKPGDAETWGDGLDIEWISSRHDFDNADAILLMGLPEGTDGDDQRGLLKAALEQGLPLYCTNPDRGSPRADDVVQLSPGALAHDYRNAGGVVTFYGKPHQPVFDALGAPLGTDPSSVLMVGDSLEHDIAGGAAAGWKTAFVLGGLHAGAFLDADPTDAVIRLAAAHGAPLPDFLVRQLADELD